MTNNTNNVSELSTIVPKETEVVIGGKTYEMEKWTLGTDVWIEQKFGVNRQEFLTNLGTEKIGRLVFKLLKEEDKRKFGARKIEAMDDEGNLVKQTIPGWQVLLESLATEDEIKGVYRAVLTCLGASSAIIQAAEVDAEKKLKGPAQKSPRKRSVGARS